MQSVGACDTSPKRRPCLLQVVSIGPDLLGREDRDRVDEAEFLIGIHLSGREDSLSTERHLLASWLMGQGLNEADGRPLTVLVAAEPHARKKPSHVPDWTILKCEI